MTLKKFILPVVPVLMLSLGISAVLYGQVKTADSSCIRCHTDKSRLITITEKLPQKEDAACGTDPGEG